MANKKDVVRSTEIAEDSSVYTHNSGSEAFDSVGNETYTGIALGDGRVSEVRKPYVSPVDEKIKEDFQYDGDAWGGDIDALKFSGGRSDKA